MSITREAKVFVGYDFDGAQDVRKFLDCTDFVDYNFPKHFNYWYLDGGGYVIGIELDANCSPEEFIADARWAEQKCQSLFQKNPKIYTEIVSY